MTPENKVEFFDGIASQWDGWEDAQALGCKLALGLEELGVAPDETVLDVGCGTGNLTKALLLRLSPAGRVVAVDFSPGMLQVARGKIHDERTSWHLADARQLPLGDTSCDRVICCSVWPHFDDPREASAELVRVLKVGGKLHVWHLMSRDAVNAVHTSGVQAIHRDILEPAQATARVLEAAGLQVITVIDDDERYLVSASKPVRLGSHARALA
ncbi:MAG: methyltransferase domain-containing protein [Polyangiaceae bacterium]|nr:methyltransferase domain-containing protein [Polyangiaceae bacterium]